MEPELSSAGCPNVQNGLLGPPLTPSLLLLSPACFCQSPRTLRNSIPPSWCLWPHLPGPQHPHGRFMLSSSLNLCGASHQGGPHSLFQEHSRNTEPMGFLSAKGQPLPNLFWQLKGKCGPEALSSCSLSLFYRNCTKDFSSLWVRRCSLWVHLKTVDPGLFYFPSHSSSVPLPTILLSETVLRTRHLRSP